MALASRSLDLLDLDLAFDHLNHSKAHTALKRESEYVAGSHFRITNYLLHRSPDFCIMHHVAVHYLDRELQISVALNDKRIHSNVIISDSCLSVRRVSRSLPRRS